MIPLSMLAIMIHSPEPIVALSLTLFVGAVDVWWAVYREHVPFHICFAGDGTAIAAVVGAVWKIAVVAH